MSFRRQGILFVISAPSGAGKTTLCTALRKKSDFVWSISCTTRSPRSGEMPGEDYHFLSLEQFKSYIQKSKFLEYSEVHGHLYGTLKEPVLENLKKGIDVLLDIDTIGASAIRLSTDSVISRSIADVFIVPPNIEEIRRRLIRRGTESKEQIEIRVSNAEHEMNRWKEYRYTIVSSSIEEDIEKFRAIMRAERYLSHRMYIDD